jgi:hypothetical protein
VWLLGRENLAPEQIIADLKAFVLRPWRRFSYWLEEAESFMPRQFPGQNTLPVLQMKASPVPQAK